MPRKLAPTFEGKPCGKCSCTTRYVNGAKNCVACAQKRAALPEKRQATKEWLRNTEEGREAVRRGNRSRNLRDKEKVLARSEVRNYWRQGKLPHPRDGHSAVVNGDIMIIFGGDRHQMPFNDTYVYYLVEENIKTPVSALN